MAVVDYKIIYRGGESYIVKEKQQEGWRDEVTTERGKEG